MHATSSFLFLCFLFASFLSIANAYPRPQSLAVRDLSPGTAAAQRTGSQRAKTSQNNPHKKKLETEEEERQREREELQKEREEKKKEKPEREKVQKNDKKGKKNDPGGPGKNCDVPVPQQFKDGPECKEIAEAFNNCGRSPQDFCKPNKQKKCLCNQAGKFSDTLLKRCYDFLAEQNPSASQGLRKYQDICGS